MLVRMVLLLLSIYFPSSEITCIGLLIISDDLLKKGIINKITKYKQILRILEAAKKRNLLAGLHNGTPEYAQKMIDKGFNLVTVGSDSRYITAGAKSDLEKLKGIKSTKSKGY